LLVIRLFVELRRILTFQSFPGNDPMHHPLSVVRIQLTSKGMINILNDELTISGAGTFDGGKVLLMKKTTTSGQSWSANIDETNCA
jgi:hypothetical protein